MTDLKVYVAGKYSDKEQIHQRILELEKAGISVTHDWTQVEQHDRSFTAFGAYAKYDIDAVKACEAVVFLMEDPEYAYRGTYTELGAALALEKKCIIVCPHEEAYCKTNVFFHHPDIIQLTHWDQVITTLRTTKELN